MTTPDLATLIDPEAHADGRVEENWRRLRTAGSVAYHDGSTYPPFWSLTRYEQVKEAYASPDRFSSEGGVILRPADLGPDPGASRTLALTDPPRHGQIRTVLAPQFRESCARQLGDIMRADIRAVLAEAADHAEVEAAHAVGARLSALLISRLMGVPETDLEQVGRWLEEAFAASIPITSHHPLAAYLIDLMYDRMEHPADDAVSKLVDGKVGGELLDETDVLLNCENLVGASENAGLTLAAGLAALLDHPDQWATLGEHPDLVPTAAEEILRWASSATHSMRTVTHDLTIADQRLRAGDKVVLWVRSANRDELVFERADHFDIRRRPNRHLSLGTGEHVCIGQTMARHQLRMFLQELLSSRAELVATGPPVALRSIAVNGPAVLPMRIRLHRAPGGL